MRTVVRQPWAMPEPLSVRMNVSITVSSFSLPIASWATGHLMWLAVGLVTLSLSPTASAQTQVCISVPCAYKTDLPAGKDASSGSFTDQKGKNGTNGNTPGSIAVRLGAGAYIGQVSVQSLGTKGGDGSNAYTGGLGSDGGTGAAGGNGGPLFLDLGPNASITGYVSLQSNAGAGGNGGEAQHQGTNGTASTGGLGGNILVGGAAPLAGAITSAASSGNPALQAYSLGGAGGVGNSSFSNSDGTSNDDGVDAANAGVGGNVTVNLGAISITSSGGVAVDLLSRGGSGGNGGNPASHTLDGASGGNGGNGALGGSVTLNLGSATIILANGSGGVVVRSFGGVGGIGGQQQDGGEASGGQGGVGADGGTIVIQHGGAVTTQGGDSLPGILAQSFGGVGASGGGAGGWGASGGAGGTGGNGGSVSITGNGTTTTTGTNSPGIIVQSIGGGGGSGGDSTGWEAVGGDAAGGGNGGNVTVSLGGKVSTSAERSVGIIAQSIGGGGGNGGNASGKGVGLTITIGGIGGAGGTAGQVAAANSGSITTTGLHSTGLVLQAIGGGGGNGGAAYSKDISGGAGASVALGGSGGGGGAGGAITQATDLVTSVLLATNSGRIGTTGANAFGILAQSIGGGGGVGGASAATSKVYALDTDPPLPTISIAVSLGGKGGSGGSGAGVTLVNTGLITTSGQGSAGIVSQSIGGGGGTGGDASATSTAKGGDSPITVSTAVAFGGNGGGAGSGGAVTVTTGGLILTTGESADGILAQSIGGGGGNGGGGDGQSKSSGDNTAISTTLTMGGQAKSGGDGGIVTVTNSGAILTLGDGASGIMAQAIGGGGGRGGGAAGTSSGTYSAKVNLGGIGGNGGDTWKGSTTNSVAITNTGSIVTFGADAPGIVAQSIGGGGGAGGKAASSIGSKKSTTDGGNGSVASVSSAVTSVNNALAAAGLSALAQYNSVSGLTGLANNLLGNTQTQSLRLGDAASDAEGLNDLGSSSGDSGDDSKATSITIGVSVGGAGGAGGSAGIVTVTNNGSIGTVGAMSDGILAQAIGGGGGKGGAAISSTSSGDIQGSLGVGGTGSGGGNGAPVNVTNTGSIITIGGLSAGIVAQSIAGGGGIGGTSGSKVKSANDNGTIANLPLSIGGNGGASGTAGQVYVINSGSILTKSHNAIGIIAQSISGGGGIVKTLSTDAGDNNGGAASASGGDYGINLTFGGSSGTPNAGSSGLVNIMNSGSISTAGKDAYGILAQSIGGGGGLVLGGTPVGTNFFGTGKMVGSADVTDGVTVTNNGSIATTGPGAVGIFAQSIGGGGGLAGDTGLTAQRTSFVTSLHDGSGGPVHISVGQGGTVTTSGANTPAILVQSIGGGGGRITNNGIGAYSGTASGTGYGGAITIAVNGTVSATGAASPAIFAESAGQGGASTPATAVINVTVAQGATVSGGTDFNPGDGYGAGIYLVTGGLSAAAPNVITNNGTITSVRGTGGTAVYSVAGYTKIDNFGTLNGSYNFANDGGSGVLCPGGICPATGAIMNHAGGTLNTGTQINLGALGSITNQGTIAVGGAGQIATTVITGRFVQAATGRLVVDTNHSTGQSDLLSIVGSAELAGTIEVHPVVVANRAVTVLTATAGVNLDDGLSSSRTHLYRFAVAQVGSSVQIQPRAEFTSAAASLGPNQQRLAAHLQQLWDSGANMDAGFTALAGVADSAGYRRSLNSLGGTTVGGIVAAKQAASERFTDNMINCELLRGEGLPLVEESCIWMRINGSRTSLDGSSDQAGYQQDAVTYQIGGQKEVAPGWFIGTSLGYESSWLVGKDDNSKVVGEAALAGVMLKHQTGSWVFTSVLDGGYGWYRSKRQVSVGSANGQANGSPGVAHGGLHLRAEYLVSLGNWYMKPNVTVEAIYRHMSGYGENGSTPFNLNVKSSSDATGGAVPMIEVGHGGGLAGVGTLRGFVGVGAAFYVNNDWQSQATLQLAPAGTGAFTLTSKSPNATAKVNVGIDLFTFQGVEAKLTYSTNVAPGYSSQAVIGRLAYAF
jgi:hypothetical protein